MRTLVTALAVLVLTVSARAEEAKPPPGPTPVAVTEQDKCAFERYDYIKQLAEARIRISALEGQVQALQYQTEVQTEYMTVDARFREHYKLGVGELIYQGGIFTQRPKPAAAVTPPKKD